MKIKWLIEISSIYIAILYFPLTLEKLITIPLAIFFQTKLFPRDKKLRKQLIEMYNEERKDYNRIFRVHIERKMFKQFETNKKVKGAK